MSAMNDNKDIPPELENTDLESSEELDQLLEIMDSQAESKDLSVRLPVKTEETDSSISRIAQRYNDLVEQLENLTQEIERHVNTRTSKKSRINNSLANEVMDRKIAEYALAEALQQARMANKAKSTFIANMSHELRTPLNSIIGFSEIMEQGLFGDINNERYADYVNDIHESGTHLLSLINDILDLSKIEAEAMTLDESDADVPELVQYSINLVKNLVERKDISLIVEIPEDCPKLKCDHMRVSQVLINLMSNAIKFSPKDSEIKLRILVEDNNAMTMIVSDKGRGIPKESLEKIFEPFTQVEDSSTRHIEGTGLGLALVQSFVEMHDGRIGIESIVGTGTDIYIYFPTERTLML